MTADPGSGSDGKGGETCQHEYPSRTKRRTGLIPGKIAIEVAIQVFSSCMSSLRENSLEFNLSLELIPEGAQEREEGRSQYPKTGLEFQPQRACIKDKNGERRARKKNQRI